MTKPADRKRQLSPAARHRERVLAAQRASDESLQTQAASEYELKLLELAQDKRDLTNIKGVGLKIEKKVELFPKYIPWIEGVLAANTGAQDDVLVTMLVWAIDIGNNEWALKMAEYAINHKLIKPDNYKRDIPNVVAEEIADAQLKLHSLDMEMQTDVLLKVIELTAASDLFDEVRAKLHKALGYALRKTDKPAALEQLKKAFGLHEKVGVKKDIENLEREIKNSSSE